MKTRTSVKKQLSLLQREKAATFFRHTEKLFVQHSSECETSDNDQSVNRNVMPGRDTRDMMNNASIWPYDWPIGTYSPLFT